MTDIDIVKDLVIKESGIDIGVKSRERVIVELRSLFYTLTKTLKPLSTYDAIGKSVGVNHATVLHSLSMFEVYSTYNKELNKLKDNILKRYRLEHKFYELHTIDDEIDRLEKMVAELKEHKENLKKEKNNFVD